MSRHVLAVVSDLHCGSTVGLCSPDPVELDDGGTFVPSKVQRWLYHNWLAFCQRVRVVAGKDDLTILFNGDLTDGDHHGTPQIITRDPNVQMYVLKKAVAPLLALNPVQAIVVRGTEAHVGKGASMEESFARWLHKEGLRIPKDRDSRMYSHWHFHGTILGQLIDAAHHGRMGQRPWTKSGVVGNLAAQIVMEYANRREDPPMLAFRSHYHTFHDTHGAFVTRLIQTPAWQIHTAFAHKVVPEVLSDIGGLIVVFETGKAPVVEPVIFKPRRSGTVKVA
jgi:hypothetical protein